MSTPPPPSNVSPSLRPFLIITTTYLLFTITDGALRTTTLLFAYQSNFTPLSLSIIFGFYELAGVATNIFAGLLGSRMGIKFTLISGLILQVLCFSILFLWKDSYSNAEAMVFVTVAQVLGGVSKDLVKLGGKTVGKLVTNDDQQSKLFKLVSFLTGFKNSLKGVGYFLGSFLISQSLELSLIVNIAICGVAFPFALLLNADLGRVRGQDLKFRDVFRLANPRLTRLSLARMFLFMSRDFWFEVPLPFYLRSPGCTGLGSACSSSSTCETNTSCLSSICTNNNPGGGCGGLGLEKVLVGTFLGLYIILYGQVQSWTPQLITGPLKQTPPNKLTEVMYGYINVIPTAVMGGMMFWSSWFVDYEVDNMTTTLIVGVVGFAVIFAINSSVHSYLVVKYAERDKVAVSVGFYYMSNAFGRLFGTVGSGLIYGFVGGYGGDGESRDGRQGLAWCMVAGSISSIIAATLTFGIDDDAGGLKCGRFTCVKERQVYEEREMIKVEEDEDEKGGAVVVVEEESKV
ncbi:hypothetical protein TrVE_jg3999 [Triparma verrucosa]|uniref:Uncharacterized protein n=1 Tax=Triparma verrucosa TaxID=1606542 RepID=A0A9W7FE65_9STRA|nr:hypothetical protein TrVE_jg3999 [Triparma verrucosa]